MIVESIWCLWAYWQSNTATWTQSANVGQYSIVHSAHTGQPQLSEWSQTALRSQVYDEQIGQPGWRTPPLYCERGACTVGMGSLRVTLGSTFVGWPSYRPVLSWDFGASVAVPIQRPMYSALQSPQLHLLEAVQSPSYPFGPAVLFRTNWIVHSTAGVNFSKPFVTK